MKFHLICNENNFVVSIVICIRGCWMPSKLILLLSCSNISPHFYLPIVKAISGALRELVWPHEYVLTNWMWIEVRCTASRSCPWGEATSLLPPFSAPGWPVCRMAMSHLGPRGEEWWHRNGGTSRDKQPWPWTSHRLAATLSLFILGSKHQCKPGFLCLCHTHPELHAEIHLNISAAFFFFFLDLSVKLV